jgi:DHA1 family tetracycline resistance protein-like MFS transporter
MLGPIAGGHLYVSFGLAAPAAMGILLITAAIAVLK